MTQFEPKRIFSFRVDNYIKYSPGYPLKVLDILQAECGLSPSWHVADIGSGTGLLGRTLSIAHAPQPEEPGYHAMLPGLKEIFDQFQSSGKVTLWYETELYFGHLT